MAISRLFTAPLCLILSAWLLPAAAWAVVGTPSHEITGGPSVAGFNHSSGGVLSFSGDSFAAGLTAGYARAVGGQWQVGGKVALLHSSAGEGLTRLQLLAGPSYNFVGSSSLADATFLRGLIGLQSSSGAFGGSDFMWEAEIGKRVPLTDSVSWVPALTVEKIGDGDLIFNVVLLNFSFFLP